MHREYVIAVVTFSGMICASRPLGLYVVPVVQTLLTMLTVASLADVEDAENDRNADIAEQIS